MKRLSAATLMLAALLGAPAQAGYERPRKSR